MSRWVLAVCVVAAVGCPAEVEVKQEIAGSSNELYYLSFVTWPQEEIPVCWTQMGGYATEKAVVRDAIVNSWGRHSSLVFTGWNWCVFSSVNSIRLTAGGESEARWLGNGGIGYAEVMLDFADRVERRYPPRCTGLSREGCIAAIAIHEFGHALGFAHEHNRPTATGCDLPHQGSYGDYTFGEYDPESIMNYCSATTGPSQTDYAGLVHVYGPEMGRPFVHNTSVRCIHPLGGSPYPSEGTPAVLHDGCQHEPRLQLEPIGLSNFGRAIRQASSGMCLQAESTAQNPPNGTRVVFGHDCDSTAAQITRLASGSLQHVSSGKCVHPRGGSANPGNGTELVLWDGCDLDRIGFRPYFAPGRLGHHSGMCVHPQSGGANPGNGTPAVLWADCTNASRLRYRMRGSGSLQHIDSGKCLHPEGGSSNPPIGTRLVFWEGCDEARLEFEVTGSGRLRHVMSGKCLTPMFYEPDVGAFQGQSLMFGDCGVGGEQLFGTVDF